MPHRAAHETQPEPGGRGLGLIGLGMLAVGVELSEQRLPEAGAHRWIEVLKGCKLFLSIASHQHLDLLGSVRNRFHVENMPELPIVTFNYFHTTPRFQPLSVHEMPASVGFSGALRKGLVPCCSPFARSGSRCCSQAR